MSADLTAPGVALAIYAAGWNPIPIGRAKMPTVRWERLQTERPERAWVESQFRGPVGVAVVCGQSPVGSVFGFARPHLVGFEFEGAAVALGLPEMFADAAEDVGLGEVWRRITEGYTERSPSGGLHHPWVSDDPVETGPLARMPGDEEGTATMLVEVRGDGAYLILAPTGAEHHPHGNGQGWQLVSGGVEDMAHVSGADTARLLDLAREFDRMPPEDDPPPRTTAATDTGDRPGDEFNRANTAADVLTAANFTRVRQARLGQHWRRPGKDDGQSATVWAEDDRTTLWSTSIAAPAEYLTGRRRLTPWQLHVALNYRGNHSAAGKAWRVDHPRPPVDLAGLIAQPGEQPWPTLDKAALYGPAGDAVRLLAPYSEADPAAMLVQLLAGLGAMIGSGPHVRAGHVNHPLRLSVVVVGQTAKARKGTSWAAVGLLLDRVNPTFMLTRVLGGFGSGEAVVDEVRDPQPGSDDKPGDDGAADKRLLIREAEFARVLRVAARETSVLSQIIREAWDGGRLETRARTRKAVASGHHIALAGHITADELRRNLAESEAANGFANRILWVCAKRQRLHPFDDEPPGADVDRMAKRLAKRVEEARTRGTLRMSPEARTAWRALYETLAEDDPGGLLGAVVARSEAQVQRLALGYALLDGAAQIEPAHLDAAAALWAYCRASAAHIFGDAVGDLIADTLIRAIKAAGPAGLDFTAQSKACGGHATAARLAVARAHLERVGLIVTKVEETEGRPRTVSRIAKEAKKAQ